MSDAAVKRGDASVFKTVQNEFCADREHTNICKELMFPKMLLACAKRLLSAWGPI